MRSCADHAYKVTCLSSSGLPPLATLACCQFVFQGLCTCCLLCQDVSPWDLHQAGSFSSFGFNVTASKKPFLTTSPYPASPTPVTLSHALFYSIYSTYYCHLKLNFYLFVYSFMISLPTLEHTHHDGGIWGGLNTVVTSGPRTVPGCTEGITGSEKLSNWPEVTGLQRAGWGFNPMSFGAKAPDFQPCDCHIPSETLDI